MTPRDRSRQTNGSRRAPASVATRLPTNSSTSRHSTASGRAIAVSAAPLRDLDDRIKRLRVHPRGRVGAEEGRARAARFARADARAGDRLMRVQDDERRRIAQTLHETTAQDLAGLKMLLAGLSRRSPARVRRRSCTAHRKHRSGRTIDEAYERCRTCCTRRSSRDGLVGAPVVRQRVSRIAAGSRSTSICRRRSDDSQDVETALFRVVQEALINVHRHAQSACVDSAAPQQRSSDAGSRGSRPRHVAGGVEQLPAGGGAPASGSPVCANVSSTWAGRSTSSPASTGRPCARTFRSSGSRHEIDAPQNRRRRRSRRRSPWRPRAARVASRTGRSSPRPTGREAVDAVKRHRPEIVVMDIGLPELNGLEATRQIVQESPQTEVSCSQCIIPRNSLERC